MIYCFCIKIKEIDGILIKKKNKFMRMKNFFFEMILVHPFFGILNIKLIKSILLAKNERTLTHFTMVDQTQVHQVSN